MGSALRDGAMTGAMTDAMTDAESVGISWARIPHQKSFKPGGSGKPPVTLCMRLSICASTFARAS